MSRVVGWIAVQGMSEEGVAEALGLVAAPDAPKARASICTLPNGWRLLFTVEFDFPTPERMSLLSTRGTAIALSADERTMFSVVRGYKHGKAVFAVEHDGGTHGARHIAAAGTIPAAWKPILEKAYREQDEEDAGDAMVDFVFDAPAALAEALCGYRDDGPWPEGHDPESTLLVEKKRPGLWVSSSAARFLAFALAQPSFRRQVDGFRSSVREPPPCAPTRPSRSAWPTISRPPS